MKQESNRSNSDMLCNLAMAFKFPHHYDANPSLEKDVYAQCGPKILKSVMRAPLAHEMHHGRLLKAYFYTTRDIVQGSAFAWSVPHADNMDELKMVVQMYSLKYLARLFFRMTKKAERLAVFTPVEGETDDMLTARVEELIDELRAFVYVEEADTADDRIREMVTDIATGAVERVVQGGEAMAAAVAAASSSSTQPTTPAPAAAPPQADTGFAHYSGQGRRLD